jgi:hypothetical protein
MSEKTEEKVTPSVVFIVDGKTVDANGKEVEVKEEKKATAKADAGK